MATTHERITVSLIKKTSDDLDKLTASTGLSKTDLVNRAVQLYAFADEEARSGGTLAVQRGDGDLYKVKLI